MAYEIFIPIILAFGLVFGGSCAFIHWKLGENKLKKDLEFYKELSEDVKWCKIKISQISDKIGLEST